MSITRPALLSALIAACAGAPESTAPPVEVASLAVRELPPAAALPLGRTCERDAECLGGKCIRMSDGVGRCTVTCAAGCPSGWSCAAGLEMCVPENLAGRQPKPAPRFCLGGCDDGNACSDDRCNAGVCTHSWRKDGWRCDDGDPCTRADACASSEGTRFCVGEAMQCDDGNTCTDDWCAEAGCRYTERDGSACDDGDACTTDDACAGAACLGASVVCAPGNDCEIATCDSSAGCSLQPRDEGPCDDGDACTTGEDCTDGACGNGLAVVCDDGNACTVDVCDAATGACASVAVEGAPCSDGDLCTVADSCAAGSCAGVALQCDDGNACTADACVAGECPASPVVGDCDDGNACTTDDRCAAGACAGATIACDDGNPCTADTCDIVSGCVALAASGAACDDGSACTHGDVCSDGACSGAAIACDDGNPCTEDHCFPGQGCWSGPGNGGSCDDGNACTTADHCDGSECLGVRRHCDDQNPCTADKCDPAIGCRSSADDSRTCNDGSACTTGDRCVQSLCVGSAVSCDDGNSCSHDICSPAFGCANYAKPDGAACSDGNRCTAAWEQDPLVFVGDIAASGQGAACLELVRGPKSRLAFACLSGGVLESRASGVTTLSVPLAVVEGHPEELGSSWSLFLSVATGPDGASSVISAEVLHEEEAELILLQPLAGSAFGCQSVAGAAASQCSGAFHWTHYAKDVEVGEGALTVLASTRHLPEPTDLCASGYCTGTAKTCDDNNGCTQDACDPAEGGCVFAPMLGRPCDDGALCTKNDVCTAAGACVGAARSCDDGNPCTNDTCSEADGCTAVVLADGSACEDGNPCTAAPCPARAVASWLLSDAPAPGPESTLAAEPLLLALPGFFGAGPATFRLAEGEARIDVAPDGVGRATFVVAVSAGPGDRLGELWHGSFTLAPRGLGDGAAGALGPWLGLVEGYQPAAITESWTHWNLVDASLQRVEGGGVATLFAASGATVQLGDTANGRSLGLGLQARVRFVHTSGVTTRFGQGEWASTLTPVDVPACPLTDQCAAGVCAAEQVPGCVP